MIFPYHNALKKSFTILYYIHNTTAAPNPRKNFS